MPARSHDKEWEELDSILLLLDPPNLPSSMQLQQEVTSLTPCTVLEAHERLIRLCNDLHEDQNEIRTEGADESGKEEKEGDKERIALMADIYRAIVLSSNLILELCPWYHPRMKHMEESILRKETVIALHFIIRQSLYLLHRLTHIYSLLGLSRQDKSQQEQRLFCVTTPSNDIQLPPSQYPLLQECCAQPLLVNVQDNVILGRQHSLLSLNEKDYIFGEEEWNQWCCQSDCNGEGWDAVMETSQETCEGGERRKLNHGPLASGRNDEDEEENNLEPFTNGMSNEEPPWGEIHHTTHLETTKQQQSSATTNWISISPWNAKDLQREEMELLHVAMNPASLNGRIAPNTASDTSAIPGSILSHLPSYIAHHVSRNLTLLRPYISSPFSDHPYRVLRHGSFVLQQIEELSYQQDKRNEINSFDAVNHPCLGSNLPQKSFHFYLLTNGIIIAYSSSKATNAVKKNANAMKQNNSTETDPLLLCFSLYGNRTLYPAKNEQNLLPKCIPLHVETNQPFGFQVSNILLLLPRNIAPNPIQKDTKQPYCTSDLYKRLVTITLSLDLEEGGTFIEGYQFMTSMTQCMEGTCQQLWDEGRNVKSLWASEGMLLKVKKYM